LEKKYYIIVTAVFLFAYFLNKPLAMKPNEKLLDGKCSEKYGSVSKDLVSVSSDHHLNYENVAPLRQVLCLSAVGVLIISAIIVLSLV
jgi:hypothetical protein